MSYSGPSYQKSESQKRITDVVDYTNIDDFFSQPSPHELTATSEHRVQEIIEDLKRQTVEEMKKWSWRPNDEDDFNAFKFFDDDPETGVISDRDMVSSPVSLLTVSSSPSLSAESNCPAAIPVTSKVESCTESVRHTRTRFEASPSASQTQSLRASNGNHTSNKPTTKLRGSGDLDSTSSRQLNAKRRAQIPPAIPIVARDFAYQCPGTPLEDPRTPPLPPPTTPATPSAALQQITQLEKMLNAIRTSRSGRSSVSDADSPTLDTLMRDRHARDTTKNLDSAHISPVAPLRIKRKPLPADSPLRVSLETHPVFAKIAPGLGRDGLWM